MKGLFNRAQVNAAILKVITTQFKKDAKEAHRIVEEAGYQICKIGGGYRVYNNDTRQSGRFVELEMSKNGYRAWIQYGPYVKQRVEYKYTTEVKFDFVGCLDKPVNTEYYKLLRSENESSKSYQAYDRLKSASWSVKYEKERIARIQKQIAQLQDELVKATESKVRDEQRMLEVKRELGLVK